MYQVLYNSEHSPVDIAKWLDGERALGNKLVACNGDFYIFEAVEQSVERTLLNQTLEMMSNDMHTVSSRPCPTCKFISKVLGQPFGCYKFQKRMP